MVADVAGVAETGGIKVLATAREHRAHRRHCRQVLAEMPLPAQFSLEGFCRQVGEHRGRPLHLLLSPRQNDRDERACGAWFATSTEDFIFVDPRASALHREHIVLHELGHMLCGHVPKRATRAELMAYLFPTAGPDVVAHMLNRTVYSTPREAEAEVFATMAGARIDHRRPPTQGSLSFTPSGSAPAPSQALEALSQMLGLSEQGGS